jgi:hypothetical protein
VAADVSAGRRAARTLQRFRARGQWVRRDLSRSTTRSALELAYFVPADIANPSREDNVGSIAFHANTDAQKAGHAAFGMANSLTSAFGKGMLFSGFVNDRALVTLVTTNGKVSVGECEAMTKRAGSSGAP